MCVPPEIVTKANYDELQFACHINYIHLAPHYCMNLKNEFKSSRNHSKDSTIYILHTSVIDCSLYICSLVTVCDVS